jgi:DNA-directed RNA polymerase specialized sigma subunit
VNFQKEFNMQKGEEVKVKTEKNILCGEEWCIGIKHEKAIYSAEADEDVGIIEDMKQQLLQNHLLQPQRQVQEQQDQRQQLLCAVRQLYQREQQVLQIWLQQI